MKRRHRKRVDFAQVMRLDVADAIPRAAAKANADGSDEQRGKCFHYSGEAVASGVGEGLEGTSGAVVLSGASEAGGGRDSSSSGGGNGATSSGEVRIIEGEPLLEPRPAPAPALVVAAVFVEPFGFCAVAAVRAADCKASPYFARN